MGCLEAGTRLVCTESFSVASYADMEHMENMMMDGSFDVAEGDVYEYVGPGQESDAHLEGDGGWLEVSWDIVQRKFAPAGAGKEGGA